jgi:hypothetical protein
MKNIFCGLSVILLMSCSGSSKKQFDQLNEMQWLIGNWENNLEEGILTEQWSKKNDSTFTGQSYYLKGKDTIHSEKMELTERDEELYYIASVKGQNKNEPVEFKRTAATENAYTFENPQHDYPQKIVYKKNSDIQLNAIISGIQQGKASSENIILNRK